VHCCSQLVVVAPTSQFSQSGSARKQVTITEGPPKVSDAICAKPDRNVPRDQVSQRQLRHSERGDRCQRNSGAAHGLDELTLPSDWNLTQSKTVGDVYSSPESQRVSALEDQFDLKRSKFTAVVQVNVESDPTPVGNCKKRVQLPDRIPIDGCRIQTADVVRSFHSGAIEKVYDTGPTQNSILWKCDDLHLNGIAEASHGLANDFDSVKSEAQVDIDVSAEGGCAMTQHLPEHVSGRLHAWDTEFLAVCPFVGDTALGGRLPGVRNPRLAPPALVEMRVRIDERRKGQQTASIDDLHGGVSGSKIWLVS
jgi:hypothetical protein